MYIYNFIRSKNAVFLYDFFQEYVVFMMTILIN